LENLISFFVHNPFILIIVVGLLYSMFFRKSPIEKRPGGRPTQSPSNRMPNFGGSPVFAPKPPQGGAPVHRDITGRATGFPPEESPQPVSLPRFDSPTYALPVQSETALRHAQETARPVQRQAPQARQAPKSGQAAAAQIDTKVALTPDDLARAVIWAEIIGQPRARRPYIRR